MTRFAVLLPFTALVAVAQQPNPAPAKPAAPHDAVMEVASNLIGRPLFFRCFCAENNLSFDAQGKLTSNPKATDWTLAAVNIQKAERKGPGEVELDGVRVAIRFATDRHEFDRHPQNDFKVKVMIADNGDAKAFARALHAVFSDGIDREFQHSMPTYWVHYFDPKAAWQDDLVNATIYNPPAANSPDASHFKSPEVSHRSEAGYTPEASHDHVEGESQLRAVVDTNGTARRILILQPLGYGLDARAAESAEKYRFTAGTMDGKPVDSTITLREQFSIVALPGH